MTTTARSARQGGGLAASDYATIRAWSVRPGSGFVASPAEFLYAPAVIGMGEDRPDTTLTRGELRLQVGAFAAQLRACGVRPGDRVAGYPPTTAEAVVALPATAADGDLGARRSAVTVTVEGEA